MFIDAIKNCSLPLFGSTKGEEQSNEQKIKRLGLEAIGAFAFSITVLLGISPYCPKSSDIANFFGLTCFQHLANGNFRKITNLFRNACGFSIDAKNLEKPFRLFTDPLLFYIGTGNRITLFIHEYGHAYLTKALYHTSTKIVLPFIGGYMDSGSHLWPTSWGKQFTYEGRETLIHAGGPIFDMMSCSTQLILSRLLANKCPTISSYLKFVSYFDFIGDIGYALGCSYNYDTYERGDFTQMYKFGGIHPLTSAAVIAAIPVLLNKCMDVLGIGTQNEPLAKRTHRFFSCTRWSIEVVTQSFNNTSWKLAKLSVVIFGSVFLLFAIPPSVFADGIHALCSCIRKTSSPITKAVPELNDRIRDVWKGIDAETVIGILGMLGLCGLELLRTD